MERLAIIFFFACISMSSTAHLPWYFPRCSRNTPNLGECLVQVAEILKPRIRDGVEELKIPSLNPLVLPKISMQQDKNEIKYSVDLTNLTITGIDAYKFKKLDFDTSSYILRGTVSFSKLLIKTDYNIDIDIVGVPLTANGVAEINTGLTTTHFTLHADPREIDDVIYLRLKDAKIKLDVKDATSKFKGTVNGDKDLSEFVQYLLTQNSEVLLKNALPAIESTIRELVMELWENAVGEVPYDEILPL